MKKLMFIRSILVMDQDVPTRVIFCDRTEFYLENRNDGDVNIHRSPVFDLLNTCVVFGFLDKICDMVRLHHFYSRAKWKEMVWKRGWELEDIHWELENRLHRSLGLMKNISVDCRYLTWWRISDKYPTLIKKCETLVKIVSHSSILRSDDLRLKNQTNVAKMCDLCNLFENEDARHMILHCTYFERERNEMFNEIDKLDANVNQAMRDSTTDILYTLLARPLVGLDHINMEKVWLVSLEYIYSMYQANAMRKRGIG